MGKNPCPVCATPDAVYVGGRVLCGGCHLDVPALLVVDYLKQAKKAITFERATAKYERARFRNVFSFGHWLVLEKLELVGKP